MLSIVDLFDSNEWHWFKLNSCYIGFWTNFLMQLNCWGKKYDSLVGWLFVFYSWESCCPVLAPCNAWEWESLISPCFALPCLALLCFGFYLFDNSSNSGLLANKLTNRRDSMPWIQFNVNITVTITLLNLFNQIIDSLNTSSIITNWY